MPVGRVFSLCTLPSAGGSRDLLGRAASARTLAVPLLLTLALAAAPTLAIAIAGKYGDATLWCWVSDPNWAMTIYYIPLLFIWAVAVGSMAIVGMAVRRRVALVREEERSRRWELRSNLMARARLGNGSTHPNQPGG